jgi:hypothetical protein
MARDDAPRNHAPAEGWSRTNLPAENWNEPHDNTPAGKDIGETEAVPMHKSAPTCAKVEVRLPGGR